MQLVQEKAQKYNENGYKLASVICRQFLTIAAKVLAAFQDDFLTKWMRYTIYEDKKEDLDRIEERLRNLNNV